MSFGRPTLDFEIWSRSEAKCVDHARGFVTTKRDGGVYGTDASEAVEIAKRRLCGEIAVGCATMAPIPLAMKVA